MKIVFMGTPDFAVPSLTALVNNGYDVVGIITQPDKPFGRKQSCLKAPPVKEAALKLGINTILQPTKVRTDEFVNSIKALEPDLIVTAAYGRILTKAVLDVPRLGCINVHGSLLPKYRGAAPIQWALINGDAVTGITTIFMDEGMDTGDILLMREINIPSDMNCEELFNELKELGASTLLETIEQLEKGTLTRTPQDHSKAVYAPMIEKENGLIDWSKSAIEVHNLIRGTNPWPGAYTYRKGTRMKIWKSTVLDYCPADSPEAGLNELSVKSQPGKVLRVFKDNLIVATGDGCLRVSTLQFENCRRMNICECGHNMDEGEILG